MAEDGAVATTRDEDMVAIARMLAPVSGVRLTGPRMDFAAARLESAGFDAAVGTRGVRSAAMLFLDPSAAVVFRMGSRSLVNAVAGYDKAAIFVEGMPEVAVASLFAAVGSRGYRLRPETAMFGNNGAIRWLIVSRRPVSAAAETIHPLSVSLARIESARLVADRLDRSGDVLVYLGEGCDGEALRSFRPGGRIEVVGESYQTVDIAQTAYGPDSVLYRPLRPSTMQAFKPEYAGFYMPDAPSSPGDMPLAIQYAGALLLPGGVAAFATDGTDEQSNAMARQLAADGTFSGCRVDRIRRAGIVVARLK
jgi:hypothetical protein